MTKYINTTFLIMATNETDTLIKTVKTVISHCPKIEICDIIICYPDFVSTATLNTIEYLIRTYPDVSVVAVKQTKNGVGAAAIEVFSRLKSSHVILMDADWSHDYTKISQMLDIVRNNPNAICKCSRRMNKNSFHNYNRFQYILNSAAQIFLRILYGNICTDMTDALQIAPVELYQSICWDSTDFAFLMELLLRPMRLGCEIIEYPVDCYGRQQGISYNHFSKKFGYLVQAIKIRLTPVSKIAPGYSLPD